MWTIRCRLTVGDHTLPEFDATPALGLALIAIVVLLVGHNTMVGG